MTSPWFWHRLPGLCFMGALACTSVSVADGPATIGGTELSFDQGAVELAPGDVVDLFINASADVGRVSVGLEGDYGDASLEVSDVVPAGGHGTVRLHAPTSPANFYVVASAAHAAAARLYVAVSAHGFATLRVQPAYTGKRPVPLVVASAFLASTCKDLAALPPKDGAPIVIGTSGEVLVLETVPAGGHVAVSVRIAHYATGCVDIDALPPNAARDVPVTIYDRPIDLSQTNLQATFTFAPDPTDAESWVSAMAVAASEALDAFSPDPATEPSRLLDAMANATPTLSAKALFQTAQSQAMWDTTVASWIGSHTPLRTAAFAWLSKGVSLTQQDLSAQLLAGASQGQADFTVLSLGTLKAKDAGMSTPVPFSWVADVDDTVHLQGSVQVLPTMLATCAADAIAATDVSLAVDVPSALTILDDCKGLGSKLAAGSYSYGTCDATCTAALCTSALSSMWTAAANTSASVSEQTVLGITASVQATVGENAEPLSFSGAWLGSVTTPSSKFSSKGIAKATQALTPK